MCILVVGAVVGVVMAAGDPAEAARRRDNMENFCRAASDLCVFTCSGDWDCPSLSDGYICESRHGTLVVEENGERTHYEVDYSFCWHRTRSPDDPLPDPEDEPVPRWPGDGETAMCRGCKNEARKCQARVKHGEAICIKYYKDTYTDHCESAFKAGQRPRDRRGRPYQPKDKYCANVLDTEEALNSEYEDIGTDPHTRKRLLQARKKCEAKLTRECVEHFAQDLPDEEAGSRWGVEFQVKEFFGGVYEGSRTIQWGGAAGFVSGCARAAEIAGSVCINERQKCDYKANPDRLCPI